MYALIILLLPLAVWGASPIICPSGEIYWTCGTRCPKTCENPTPQPCTKECVEGCFCPDDKVRDNSSGKCVDIKDCSRPSVEIIPTIGIPIIKCQDDKIFDLCGSECPPTCLNPKPGFCTNRCAIGCFCPPGRVLDTFTNKCVSLEDCPRIRRCPPGEIFQRCGTACPPTCSNPDPEFCTLQCVTGCFCPKGQVRDEIRNVCVPLEECPDIYE